MTIPLSVNFKSNEINFPAKKIREGLYIIILQSIQQEDIAILNEFSPYTEQQNRLIIYVEVHR